MYNQTHHHTEQLPCPLPDSRTSASKIKKTNHIPPMILIIEDEPVVGNVICEVLSLAGFRTVIAPNGSKGVELYKVYESEINMVLLDFDLPYMNGEQVFHHLRQLNPNLKIIISSAYLAPEVKYRLSQESNLEFLPKPYNIKTLFAKVGHE
jgi:DNA-binding response OmpR family regulator